MTSTDATLFFVFESGYRSQTDQESVRDTADGADCSTGMTTSLGQSGRQLGQSEFILERAKCLSPSLALLSFEHLSFRTSVVAVLRDRRPDALLVCVILSQMKIAGASIREPSPGCGSCIRPDDTATAHLQAKLTQ